MFRWKLFIKSLFSPLAKSFKSNKRKPLARKWGARPLVEQLETRLVPTTVTVTSNTGLLPNNSPDIVIAGSHFSATINNDSVAFTPSGVTGTITAATASQLTVTLSGLSSFSSGALDVVVGDTGDTSSTSTQVATIGAAQTQSVIGYSTAGSNYTQNFSTLPTGTVAITTMPAQGPYDLSQAGVFDASGLAGWSALNFVSPTGPMNYAEGEPTTTTGGLFDFNDGSAGSQSLGTVSTGSNNQRFGAILQNNTGGTLNQFTLSYTGEEWWENTGGANTLDFSYEVESSSPGLPSGTTGYTTVNNLSYTAQGSQGGSGVAENGSANPNSNNETFSNVAVNLTTNWTAGSYLVIFWDKGAAPAGSSPGLGIANLSFSAADVVSGPAITNNPASATVYDGVASSLQVTTNDPGPGTPTFAVTSGTPPSFASLNQNTGLISFTPPAANVATTTTYTFGVTATDNSDGGAGAQTMFTITELPTVAYSSTANGTINQDFSTLPTTTLAATSSNSPTIDLTVAEPNGLGASGLSGWYSTNLSGSDEKVAVDSGSAGTTTTGAVYAFNDGTPSDGMALGTITTGTASSFGEVLVNTTGTTLNTFSLSYIGEQWRQGSTPDGSTDPLSFFYQVGSTSMTSYETSGTETGSANYDSSLSFTPPDAGTNGSYTDGNLAANQKAISGTVTGLNWLPGETLVIYWNKGNTGSGNDGDAVADVNFAASAGPVITSAARTTTDAGLGGTFQVVAGETSSNGGNTPYSYAISGNPSWVSINASSGLLTFTTPPTVTTSTPSTFTITATDASSNAGISQSFTVDDIPAGPAITSTASDSVYDGVTGQTYHLTAQGQNGDNSTITYAISGDPSWVSVDASSGVLTFTPPASDVSTTTMSTFTVTASSTADGAGVPQTFTLTELPTVAYASGDSTASQTFSSLPSTTLVPTAYGSGVGPFDLTPAAVFAGASTDTALAGWYAQNIASGGTAMKTAVGEATTTTGALYAFNDTDIGGSSYALGTVSTSGAVAASFGEILVNTSGQTLTSFSLSYTGEEWRQGATADTTPLSFFYQIGSTSMASYEVGGTVTGTATYVSGLSFTPPNASDPDSDGNNAEDGGLAANQVAVSGTVTGISWAPGQEIVIYWNKGQGVGGGNGLGVANVSFTAQAAAPTVATNTGLAVAPSSGSTNITSAMLSSTDPNGYPTTQITYTVTSLPTSSAGTLYINGAPQTATGGTFTEAELDTGTYVSFTAGATVSGSSFGFSVADPVSAAATGTFAIAVGTPPVLAVNSPLTLIQGATATITTSDLQVTDADSSVTDADLTFTIGTAPTNGTLTDAAGSSDPGALIAGSTFTEQDLDSGLVTYTDGGSTATSDSFTFTVLATDGGTIGSTTFNIDVNLLPTLVSNTGLDTPAGATTLITSSMLKTTGTGSSAQIEYTLTSVPTSGNLYNTAVSTTVPLAVGGTFFQNAINGTSTIEFVSNAGATPGSSDSFSFTVTDTSYTTSPPSISGTFAITNNPSLSAVSYTGGAYTQGFTGLSSTVASTFAQSGPFDLDGSSAPATSPQGAGATGLTGWSMAQIGGTTPNEEKFFTDNGGTSTGGVHAFSGSASSEVALGLVSTGADESAIGLTLVNNTGTTLTQFTLNYDGEEWRIGVDNGLDFSYQLGVTGVADATSADWTTVSALGYDPDVTTPAGANPTVTDTLVSSTVPLSWAPGQTLVIRWTQAGGISGGEGLGITNVNFAAQAAPTVNAAAESPTYTGAAVSYPQTPSDVSVTGSETAYPTPTGTFSYTYVGTGSTTYASSSTAPTNAGTYTVTVTFTSTDTNYTNATGTASFTIGAATPTVNTASESPTYTGAALAYPQTAGDVSVTGVSTGTDQTPSGSFSYTYVGTGSTTYASSSTAPTAAGTYTVTVTFTSTDTNYTNATGTASFTIGAATPTVNTASESPTYTGAALAYPQTAGDVSVTGVSTGTDQTPSGSFSYTYLGTGSTTYASSSTAPTAAGTYTVTVTFTSTDTNYTNATGTASFTIGAATPTVNTASESPTYTGAALAYPQTAGDVSVTGVSTGTDQTPGGSFSYTYLGTGSTTYASSSTAPTAAGTYTVTVTFTSTDTNYTNATGTASFTIGAATPTVKTAAESPTYTGAALAYPQTAGDVSVTGVSTGTDQTPSGSFSYTYLGTGSTTYASSSTAPTAAGTYSVTVTFTSTDTNYTNATGTASFTIGAATPTVNATAETKVVTGSPLVYNPSGVTVTGVSTGSDQTPSGSFGYTYVGVSPTTYASSSTAPSAAGTYSVTVTFNTSDPNYTTGATGTAAFDLVPVTVTESSAALSPTATTLTIAGAGFSATKAHDTVTFNNGVLGTVSAATTTALTVTLKDLAGGDLTAVVTVSGANSGAAVQVATVTPTVTASTSSLLATATTLTIKGTGFSTTLLDNVVTFTAASGVTATGTVTKATATALTVTSLSGLTGGSLSASVSVNGVSSGSAVQVATVAPVVIKTTTSVLANATTMTITGVGFDSATPGNNVVAFSVNAGTVTGTVTAATATSLTVTSLTGQLAGALDALVTTDTVPSGSKGVEVAVVAPVVTSDTLTVYPATTASLTINGYGFTTGTKVALTGGSAGTVTVVSADQLSVALSKLTSGSLEAVVTASGVKSGTAVQVATVSPVVPISSTATLLATAGTLTINGSGFDATTPADNIVTLTAASGITVTGTVTKASLTKLTVELGGTLTGGALSASVSVGAESSGPAVQVATVIPVVTKATTQVLANATTMTITGVGFDSATPGNNVVTFSVNAGTVTGTVTAATATSLTVTSLTGQLAGALDAVVATDGGSIAKAVEAGVVTPVVTSSTTSLAASATTLTINGYGFTTGTKVALTGGTAGTVTVVSANELTVVVSKLLAGSLTAVVTSSGEKSGSAVPVATVTPTVTSSTANLAASAATVIIYGSGFTAGTTVTLSSGTVGTVTVSSATELKVAVTGLAVGNLTAVVTSSGQSSGTAAQVATVIPVITKSTASLAASATTLTIDGFGFDSTTPGNNVLTFSGGVTGIVTSATSTTLTVTLSPPSGQSSLPAGLLTASVTVDGISSGATEVEVAKVL